MKNKNTKNINVYILSKKSQDKDALWETTKSKYKTMMPTLISSLEDYISASGKANRDERIFSAILILQSLPSLAFFDPKSPPRELKKDFNGKPNFDGSDVGISIAHNEHFVIVGYGEKTEIGVDIECEISQERAEKLEKRFPQISAMKTEKADEKVNVFKMQANGEIEPLELTPAHDSFTAKWTAAEAAMKCDGRGFSALPELEKIKVKTKIFTLVFESENGKEYISVAITKK